MATLPTHGMRFSHAYLARGEPHADSVRARRRISSLMLAISESARDGLGILLERELGVEIPSFYGYDWHGFFRSCELKDLLDTITIAYQHFVKGGRPTIATNWIQDVTRVLQEENLRYRIDPHGGVHFSIDEEFERGRAASIAALQGPRYANVADAFEQAYTALAAVPPDGKGAIRATFSSAEGLFRLMFTSSPRLTASEIDKHLGPYLQSVFAADTTVSGATSKLLAKSKDWVDAAHFYRHEPGKEEIAQPPLSLAINLVSLGASYIRWLAEIDSAKP